MKNIIVTIGVLCLSGFAFAQTTKDTIKLEYFSGIKLEKIPETGNKMTFVQLCTKEVDSVVSTGHISFNHSSIGKIEDCLLQYKIEKDTLRSFVIKTRKKNNTQQVIDQSTIQFGKPEIKTDKNRVLYSWKYVVNDKKTLIAEMWTTKSLMKCTYSIQSFSKSE